MRCDYGHSDKQVTVFRRRLLVAFPGQKKFQKEGCNVTNSRKEFQFQCERQSSHIFVSLSTTSTYLLIITAKLFQKLF